MTTGMTIRHAETKDIASITRILNHYILHTTSSYMEQELTEVEMLSRFEQMAPLKLFFVAQEQDGSLAGFAYAGRFRPQSAWRILETTIYLNPESKGRGIGRLLYDRLLGSVRERGDIPGLVAMITLENEHSIRFHESYGFRLTGKWEHCAYKFDRWCGTGSWYLTFPVAQ